MQEINFSSQQWRKIINSSSDGILITDAQATIIMCNQAWLHITHLDSLGYNLDNTAGTQMRAFIDNGFIKDAAVFAVLRKKGRVVMTQATERSEVFMASGNPVFDENGNIQYVVINVKDMTELTTLKRELEQSKELQKLYLKSLRTFQETAENGPIAASADMKEILETCLKISDTDVTVLILGESGTGKEVVARYIHDHSSRKANPFVTINCGAIPDSLMESELFGYVGGAFTGANRLGKKGLFEAAGNGTVLLDEIGELKLDMQVKLLRVLETKQVTRIGSTKPVEVNAHILAATNRDLKKMVAEGKFRDDLYYRINVVNIKIPPLWKRTADIPALAIYFLNTYNKKYRRNVKLSYKAFQILSEYSWPGNIRELRNVIEQLVVLSNGEYADIGLFNTILDRDDRSACAPALKVNRIIPIKAAAEEAERQILALAQKSGLSSRQMAKLLEVDQTTVSRKLRRYGLTGKHPPKQQP